MARLLIGSSNLARFYKPEFFGDFNPYQMMKCTTMDSFTALMSEVEDGSNKVIVSVFENIIVDAAKSAKTDEEQITMITNSIKVAIKLIESTATRLPDSKFCIVMPLKRPAVTWFEEKKRLVEGEIQKGIASMKTYNVTRMNCICASLQQFEKDGIHLTDDSGFIFVETLLKVAEEIFNSEDLTGGPNGEKASKPEAEKPVDLAGLVNVLKTRFESDNMMFARLREEIDSTANRTREDRVVVTGITTKDPLPVDNRQRIEKLKTLAAEVFEAIKPGFQGKILYASQGRNNDTLPMVEVKLDKVEHAVAIRKAFAEKRKGEKLTGCLERIFISNSINIGTRVRIEILKAIAKRITDAKDLAYVASFISRPVMHIRDKSSKSSKPQKSYTFIDAVKQFGSRLKQGDLMDAYAKAGKAFAGQLEQNFVVLKEADSEAAQTNFHRLRIERGRGRGGSFRARGSGRGGGSGGGGSVNETPIGARGLKRPGDEGETSSAKK
jgi:hypothetical protein